MPSVDQVLTDPALRHVRVLAGDASTSNMVRVDLVEDLDDLSAQPPAAMVVLGAAASGAANGYRLDIALRQAAAADVSAVVFTGHAQPAALPSTAEALAIRGGIVVASAPLDQGAGVLVVAATAAVEGDAPEALRRSLAALEGIQRARSTLEPGDIDGLLAIATDCLGAPVRLADPAPGEITSPVSVHGQQIGTVVTARRNGHAAATCRLVVTLTAAAIERSVDAAYRGDETPIRSRDAVLSELLVAGDTHAARVAEQARRLGIPVDGWHRAIFVHLVDDSQPPGLDFLHTLGSCSLRAVRAPRHSWHLARWDDNVVLIEMWDRDPGADANRPGLRAARRVLETTEAQFPQLQLCCGVGTAHGGIQGLRATVTEARTAAGNAEKPGEVAGYDTAGLQPMLLEWYGSDTARQAVGELLEPLERLGGERATTAIRTLQIYLDEQGSLIRAAGRLNVHRNAVAYRMRQISALLEVELTDADRRLAIQLACRARLLR